MVSAWRAIFGSFMQHSISTAACVIASSNRAKRPLALVINNPSDVSMIDDDTSTHCPFLAFFCKGARKIK